MAGPRLLWAHLPLPPLKRDEHRSHAVRRLLMHVGYKGAEKLLDFGGGGDTTVGKR